MRKQKSKREGENAIKRIFESIYNHRDICLAIRIKFSKRVKKSK